MTSTIGSRVTIVTACRNREGNLRHAIQSWLELSPFRVIICDWGSATPLTHERLGVYGCEDIVDIFRCETDQWILSWAFNEALVRVESPYTLKLDCDHLVSNKFLDWNTPKFGHFSRGHWRNAEKGQEYINGAFLSCTDLLRRVGYYDERITTYGWDDSDLYLRLYDASLGSSTLERYSLRHLDQCETARTKEQDVSKESVLASRLGIEKTSFLIDRNRILCGMLWPWNSNMFENRQEIRQRFFARHPEEAALIDYATLKAFELHYQWKGLLQKTGIPVADAYAEALYAVDRDSSNAPSSLLIAKLLKRYSNAIRSGDNDEKALVRMALLSSSSEAHLKSRLAALNKVDELCLSSGSGNPCKNVAQASCANASPQVIVKKSKLFVDAQHGLGNRLRAIGSAAAIAEASGRELVVIWQPDAHCNCRFSDLFDYKGAVLDNSLLDDDSDFEFYNYMTMEGGKKNAPIAIDCARDVYVRSAYVLNSPHSDWTRENHFIRSLRPVEAVQALVSSVRHPNDVSAHVRMEGGRKDEHLPYESSSNWTDEEHDTIDHWRSKSHFSHFIRRIEALVAEGSAERIFIAADRPETYREFRRAYGDRLAWLERSCYDRSAEQLQYALADALLLSRAPLLLGSTWSSFSELAQRLSLGGIRVELSGKDF